MSKESIYLTNTYKFRKSELRKILSNVFITLWNFLTDFKKHFWFCGNKYFLSNIRWQTWKFIVYFVHRKINSTKHFGLRYTPDIRSSPGRSVVTNQQRRQRSRSQKEAGSRWFSWMNWMDIPRWSCLARKQLSSGWTLCSWMYVIK